MTTRPHLVLVGGFLGAGKTSLILAASHELTRRGMRSAAILNDQGESLVDTGLARAQGIEAGEVTGGCFCCRLSELLRVADELRAHSPDVIFAEPVGSCTDLSATILQPLRYGDFELAPLTVLVDPGRQYTDPHMKFLFAKQLEEADLICYTKADLYLDHPGRRISARSGEGVAAWLDVVLSGDRFAGQRLLEIDYNEYARAEAALAWLNFESTIELDPARSPAMLLGPVLDQIDRGLTAAGIAIVHLKAIDESPEGYLKAAICANGQEPIVEGNLDASPAARHRLRLNLRAVGEPRPVQAIVESALKEFGGGRLNCFSPSPPNPEQRLNEVRK
jgi:hypothetical protein